MIPAPPINRLGEWSLAVLRSGRDDRSESMPGRREMVEGFMDMLGSAPVMGGSEALIALNERRTKNLRG
jgi:hypothetical protein